MHRNIRNVSHILTFRSSNEIILGGTFMHNQDVIFDIDNSRLGFAHSDCSQGKEQISISHPETPVKPVKVNGLIIQKQKISNAVWFKSAHSISKSIPDDISMKRNYNLDFFKCYYHNTIKALDSIEVVLVLASVIIFVLAYALIVSSCFFKYRKNVLCFRYLGDLTSQVLEDHNSQEIQGSSLSL